MAKKEENWITINGTHVLLEEGETKEDAIKKLESKDKGASKKTDKEKVQRQEPKKVNSSNDPHKLANKLGKDEDIDADKLTVDNVKEYTENLGYKVKGIKQEGNRILIDIDGDTEYKNKVWREIYDNLGNERNIYNYGDSHIGIDIENHNQRLARINNEKEEFVVNALKSGKYKGSIDEIAEDIYMDSPYSIHSHDQMVDLVKKHYKEPTQDKGFKSFKKQGK